ESRERQRAAGGEPAAQPAALRPERRREEREARRGVVDEADRADHHRAGHDSGDSRSELRAPKAPAGDCRGDDQREQRRDLAGEERCESPSAKAAAAGTAGCTRPAPPTSSRSSTAVLKCPGRVAVERIMKVPAANGASASHQGALGASRPIAQASVPPLTAAI